MLVSTTHYKHTIITKEHVSKFASYISLSSGKTTANDGAQPSMAFLTAVNVGIHCKQGSSFYNSHQLWCMEWCAHGRYSCPILQFQQPENLRCLVSLSVQWAYCDWWVCVQWVRECPMSLLFPVNLWVSSESAVSSMSAVSSECVSVEYVCSVQWVCECPVSLLCLMHLWVSNESAVSSECFCCVQWVCCV